MSDLGGGKDTLIGFAKSGQNAGRFNGGKGKDKILLGDGQYTIEGNLLARSGDGGFMRVNSFEKIGGINGGLFNFANGRLTVTGGVATFSA